MYQKKKKDSMDTHYSTFTAPQRKVNVNFSGGNISRSDDVHTTLKG